MQRNALSMLHKRQSALKVRKALKGGAAAAAAWAALGRLDAQGRPFDWRFSSFLDGAPVI
jgi:hypothetical protein